MTDNTLKDIKRREKARIDLLAMFQGTGRAAVFKHDKNATLKYIKNSIKNNTFVGKDANGKKHCYILEEAIKQSTTCSEFIEQLLVLMPFFDGTEEAIKLAKNTHNNIFVPKLEAVAHAYAEKARQDNAIKDATKIALETFLLNPTGSLSKFIKEHKSTLLHQEANGKIRCYLLECAVNDGHFEIVQELLKQDIITKDDPIIKKAIKKERKAKDLAVIEKENLVQGGGALTPNEHANQIAKLDKRIEIYAKIDDALSIVYKDIREGEKRGQKDELKTLIQQSTTEMLHVLHKIESSALEEAMLQTPIKNSDELKIIYLKSDTPETAHDKENFNGTYNALEAITKEERKKHLEKLHKKLIHFRNLVQKDWAKTAIKIGGLAAIGVSSGGIGVGLYFLGTALELAVDAGHDAWLEKYHVLIKKHKKLLNKSNAILHEGSAHSLERLMVLSEQAEGEAKKIIDALINSVHDNINKIEALEKQTEDAAVELLTKLICSNDKQTTIEADKFLKSFHQNTCKLKEKGLEAASKFRDDAKDITDHALEKNAKANRRLSTIKPLTHITTEVYRDLTYDVLDSQGSVSDAMASLEESYHVISEVNRREAFFIKLASALRKQEGRSLSKQNAFYKKDEPKINVGLKGQLIDFAVNASEESANLGAQSSKETAALEGLVKGLIGGVKILQEKGLKDGLKDITLQRNVAKLHVVYGSSTFLSTLLRETSDPSSASNLFSPELTQPLLNVMNELSDYLSSDVLTGIPSAQLDIGISPVGVCTMITMFLYTGIHNAWYSRALKEKLSKIIDLQNGKDISKLTDHEIMSLIKLVGETVHDFGNLLPKMMEKQLDRTEKLYKKQVNHSRRLAKYRFSRVFTNLVQNLNDEKISLETINRNPKIYSDKTILYLQQESKNPNVSIIYHDGTAWRLIEKPKTQFEQLTGLKVTPQPIEKNDDLIKITNFFGCTRELPESKKTKYDKKNKSLDKLYKKVIKNQANTQTLFYLSSLYRELVNIVSIKNRANNRDLLFALSRQHVFTTILKTSNISDSDYEKALPLINNYIEMRSTKTDNLNYLKLLGALTKEQEEDLEKLESEHQTGPFNFLTNLRFSDLTKLAFNMNQSNTRLFSESTLLKNAKSNGINIEEVLSIKQRFDSLIAQGVLEKESPVVKAFTSELKAANPNLNKYKAFLDSSERIYSLRTDNKSIYASITKLNKKLWESVFSKTNDTKNALDKVSDFCKKVTLLDKMQSLIRKQIEQLQTPESLFTQSDCDEMIAELDKCIEKQISDMENLIIPFEVFLKKPFIESVTTIKNPNAEKKFQLFYKESLKKINEELLAEKLIKFNELVVLIENDATLLIARQPNKKEQIIEEKDKLIKHLSQVVENEEIGMKDLDSLTFKQSATPINDLEIMLLALENKKRHAASPGVHFVSRDRKTPPPPPPVPSTDTKGLKNTR